MAGEQRINISAERAEKEIALQAEQREKGISLKREAINVTVNRDYDQLSNKPQINGVELIGNKTAEQIGINVPTAVSELDNDADYTPKSYVDTKVAGAYTKAETDALLDEKADADSLATVATSGNYNDLTNKPTIPTVPTKLSAFTDDLGTSPAHTHSQYANASDIPIVPTKLSAFTDDLGNSPTHTHRQYALSTDIPTVPTKLSEFTDDLGSTPTHTHSQYLTDHQDISGKADAFTVAEGLDMTANVLSNPQSIEYIVGTQTAATAVWKGVTKDATLRVGKVIAYFLPQAGTSTAATLNLTLADGTTTGAIALRRTGSSTVTTQFAADNVLILIYDGEFWRVSAYYDTNTNTIAYQVRTNSGTLPMTDIVYRYRLLFMSADMTHFVPANKSSSTNATAKRDVITTPINPFAPIVYYGTTASVAAGSSPSAANIWQQYVITLGYSFNRTGAALVLDFPKPVYLKCTPQADGSAVIDPDTPFVQALPNSEDGFIYIYLGIAYSATNIELRIEHPIFYYKNGVVRLWTNA